MDSVDCGRNSNIEQWDEIVVQLLDGSATSKAGHMPASKFLAITSSAMKTLKADTAAYFFFEFAPDNGPIRKLSVESVEHTEHELAVSLGSEQAVCKPLQRAKATLATAVLSGITVQTSNKGCCSDTGVSNSSGCCS